MKLATVLLAISVALPWAPSAAFLCKEFYKKNNNIHKTAFCGQRVTLDSDSTIGQGVSIGTGCRFSYGLRIGANAKLGSHIFGGYHVLIGEQVCVENGVNFKNDIDIPDFVMVKSINKGKDYVIIEEPQGYKYVLQKGKCIPKIRKATEPQEDSLGFSRCENNGNTFIKTIAKCKPGASISANNVVLGKLKLDSGATLGSGTTIDDNAMVTIGPNTRIGEENTFKGLVIMGVKNIIGNGISFSNANLQYEIIVSDGAQISGTIANGATLGHDCSVGIGSNVGVKSELGEFSQLGNGASIADYKKIGARSCVAYGVSVTKDLKAGYYMNVSDRPLKGFALLLNGKCETSSKAPSAYKKLIDSTKKKKENDAKAFNYSLCIASNTFIKGVGLCKAAAKIGPGNYFLGDVYLQISAELVGGHTSELGSKIALGERTKVDKGVKFRGEVTFGKDNKLGAMSFIGNTRTGNNCKIGAECSIEAAMLGDDVTIGDKCNIGTNVVLGAKVILGPSVVLSTGVVVADGIQIGAGSCVSRDLHVQSNIKVNFMMLPNGKLVKIKSGKKAVIIDGECNIE